MNRTKLRKTLLEKIGRFCQACGTGFNSSTFLHLDRMTPGVDGGEYTEENCTFLCVKCHSIKRHIFTVAGTKLEIVKIAKDEKHPDYEWAINTPYIKDKGEPTPKKKHVGGTPLYTIRRKKRICVTCGRRKAKKKPGGGHFYRCHTCKKHWAENDARLHREGKRGKKKK